MTSIEQYNNELYHYGVIGMKWGVRKNPTKAFAKASKKLDKIDKKFTKMEAKATKKAANAIKFQSSINPWRRGKGNREEERAKKYVAKMRRQARAGSNWVRAMEKSFGKTDISLTSDMKIKGEKYASTLRTDLLIRYL